MNNATKFYWDAQIRQNGEWISLYGPFDELADAEDVIDEAIKRAKTSTAFRIFPLPNAKVSQTNREDRGAQPKM